MEKYWPSAFDVFSDDGNDCVFFVCGNGRAKKISYREG